MGNTGNADFDLALEQILVGRKANGKKYAVGISKTVDDSLSRFGITVKEGVTFFEVGVLLFQKGDTLGSNKCYDIDFPDNASQKFLEIDDPDASGVYALKAECWDEKEKEWRMQGTGFEGKSVLDIGTTLGSPVYCDFSIIKSEKGFYARSNFGSKHTDFVPWIINVRDKASSFLRCFPDLDSCEERIVQVLLIHSNLYEKDIVLKRLE